MFDYKGSHDRSQVEKTIRYSIRKVSFGAASVAVAALFMFLGNGAVSATEQGVPSTNEETQSSPLKDPDVQNGTYGATPVVGQMGENSATSEATDPKNQKEPSTPTPTDVSGSSVASSSASATEAGNKTDRSSSTPSTEEVEEKARPTLDKKQLEDYVAEIDAKLASGSYATKTDESVATLKENLELAKLALITAQSQEELTKAYRKLLMTASSGLRNKPKAQVESPKLDITEGKATVGKKASNNEKATGTNSIANSGKHDSRNGQALDRNNPFRTDATTTNDDTSANQTYEAPAADANLETLSNELKNLPNMIENNKKIQDMNDLGDKTNVARGEVKEIQEFGGWKAIAQPDGTAGKFAIARKTKAGVFPIETVNTVYTNLNRGRSQYYDTYVGEQAFDRTKDYMLFLGKVRTIASENEETFNGKTYQRTGLGGSDSFGIKSFSGIEKTFKAHSPATGSKVKVSFKTGYTGDLNGTKAKYLVEVVYRQNGSEVTAYTYTFAPQQSGTAKDGKGIVTPAKDGTGKSYIRSNFNNYNLNRAEVEAKMAEDAYKPNGQAGTFTSSDIDLPIGVTDYTVRIKVTDTNRMGMGYQSPLRHYALPVTGTDFSIEQDTGAIAKKLLSRIYDKLKATETADTDGKTNETKAAYLAELEKVKTLVTSTDVKKTAEYKEALESTLSKQLALRVDKTGLIESKTLLDGLVNEDPTPGKTQDTATAYNAAKQEAIKAIEAAKTVVDNENATVAEVRDTLETVNAKQKALQRAKDGLIEAATADEKAKLKAEVDSLIKADTIGETPKSIDEYNKEFKKFEQDFNSIKTEVSNIIAKGNNATKAEVDTALSKVAEIKTKLDTAAGLLVDKGNKTELEKVVREESAVKGNFKYYNTDKTKRDAYDSAITKGNIVIKDPNATQAQVNAALKEITDAKQALNGAETNKEELRKASTTDADTTKTTDAKYYNETDSEKKKAYDNAVSAAAGVINNPNATQAQVNAALKEITDAKQALNGAETNKEELRKASTTDADTTKTTDAKYYNETDSEKKKAYDNAVSAAAGVINNPNATQAQVNAALKEITDAKQALNGAETNKEELRKASTTDADTTKTTDAKYYNETDSEKKKAYDNAVSAAAGVINNPNATQAQVNAALKEITDAKQALNGAETNKEELRKASTTDADTTKTTDAKYYNETDSEKKKAYDNAVSAAAGVINNPNATQAQVNAALKEITDAKQALNGAETNKEELRKASTTDADTTKTTDAKYYNETDSEKKKAYDNAVSAAAGVINNPNATQAQVNAALKEITDAKQALNGAETNKEELRKASTTDADTTKTTDAKYYNETDSEKKKAYDNAVSAAAGVINNPNATQAQVNAALKEITDAKQALNGAETNKEELRKASTTDADTTKTTDAKYYNETDSEKKKAYDNAVSAAAGVINNPNATQAQVNAALKEITDAKQALNGAETNKEELRKASTTDADTTKTTDAKYYNETDSEKKKAYDNAVSAAAGVINNPNATQAQVNAALKEITDAKQALNGAETNKEELRKASTTDADTTKTTDAKYYNETDSEKKKAYDNAVSAAAGVINNPNATQAQVNAALKEITDAKQALNGAETNKEELRKASTTDADTTKTTDAKYYNETDSEKKKAYDNAVSAAAGVINNPNATQAQVNAALKEITDAKQALNGAETNKEELRKASTTDADTTKTTDAKYYNETDSEKKKAYDNAVSAAAGVINNPNATQAQVNAALKEITDAKQALNGAETNKEELRKASTTDADTTKTTDAKYYNETDSEKKKAYDNAVSAAAGVINNPNATQAQVNAALKEITDAKQALNGAETNKEELRKASTTDADTTKTTDAKYYNETDSEKKKAYDNAVSAAAGVINNPNATQAQVNAALKEITDAKQALNGAETNKEELRKASTTDADTTKTTDAKYYNETDSEKKKAYDNAVSAAAGVINNPNATQAQVNAALKEITDAKQALNGAETNKEELRKASTTDADTTKTTDAKYYNETDSEKKKAYDNAVSAAAGVINNPNATQAQVNAALKEITDAKQALNGAETNKEELRKASTTDADTTKTTDAKYYNETDSEKKKAYDNAVSAAAGVINNPNATQAQVNAALKEITDAKQALNGAATDKAQLTNNNDVLNELISEDPTNGKTKATIDEYKKVKEESEKLLKEIKKVIDNKNASQIEVNKALEMVIKAKDSLENAKKSLLDAVEAREVVETIANEKIASIKADKKLSVQEKEKAIDRVERLKEKALEEIDKSKKQTEIDKVLRTFLYQIDQDSLVYERPSFDLEAFIQSSITGVVTVECGKAIRQADVIAKLNLPENVTVISIDLPDTNTLGDKFAKVTLRLADGKEITVKVPVRVVASQSGESKPETSLPDYGRNNGSTNTAAKVDKAKLEGAIRQLDELIIRESAKLDAETAKEANALSADAKKVFANADASQAEVDAMIKRIEDFMAKVALSTDHATPTNDQAAQTPAVAPATTQAAVNAGHIASAQASVRTVAKELPNTGTVDSVVSMVVAAASALLGLGLASRRRKEDEEA